MQQTITLYVVNSYMYVIYMLYCRKYLLCVCVLYVGIKTKAKNYFATKTEITLLQGKNICGKEKTGGIHEAIFAAVGLLCSKVKRGGFVMRDTDL